MALKTPAGSNKVDAIAKQALSMALSLDTVTNLEALLSLDAISKTCKGQGLYELANGLVSGVTLSAFKDLCKKYSNDIKTAGENIFLSECL
jgi:hypothetical protein